MRIPYPYLDHWHHHGHWFNPCCALLGMVLCWLCLYAHHHITTPMCAASATTTPATTAAPSSPMPPKTNPASQRAAPCPQARWLPQAEKVGMHWQRWQQNKRTFSSQQVGTLTASLRWLDTLHQQGILPNSIELTRAVKQQPKLQLKLQLDCTHASTTPPTMANT